jgi:hypothetical protein
MENDTHDVHIKPIKNRMHEGCIDSFRDGHADVQKFRSLIATFTGERHLFGQERDATSTREKDGEEKGGKTEEMQKRPGWSVPYVSPSLSRSRVRVLPRLFLFPSQSPERLDRVVSVYATPFLFIRLRPSHRISGW